MVSTRAARSADSATLAALLSAYLQESFPTHRGSSAAELERDVLSGASGLRLILAEQRGIPIGFAAWHRVYDLHWATGGADVEDLYVVPEFRGLGVALALIVAICSEAHQQGLTYLRGTSFDPASTVGRLYDRLAITMPSAQCYCSGRAFRRVAELQGDSPRAMLRQLPPKAWNYDA